MSALVLGVLNGLTIGLLAIGIVLVYKASRFINLAHGQLGALSAALLAKFVVDLGWSWQVAFPIAIAIGVLTGVVVERVFIRRMRARTSSGTRLLLLTIGIAQILLALTYVDAFRPNGLLLQREGFPVPFDSTVEIGGVVLDGPYLLILFAVPVVVVALGAFLRFSLVGKTIRAAAANPDAARLCGISVTRVAAISWGLAGGLSALAAILQAPSQPAFDAEALGPGLLLRALGAAAFGGFVRLPTALVGALVIGVAEHVALEITHNGSTSELVVYLVIVAILLVRGGVITAATGVDARGLDARRPTAVPPAVSQRPIVRYQRVWLGAAGLALAAFVPLLPYFQPDHRRFLLVLVLVYAIVGVALTVVVGWSGQVSLGHFALVGVGAFMTAELVDHGWSLPLLLLFSGALGAAIMAVIGLPALRLRGLTLAVTTLGFAVIGPSWLFRQEWFGSPQQGGIALDATPLPRGLGSLESQLSVYYSALVVLAIAVVSLGALRRSVPGRLVLAVRDNEDAAASFGVTPATVKLATLAVSGFVAATAGVLWASAWRTIGATQFAPQLSIAILAVPVIGGLGSLSGAVAGAVALYMPTFFLSGPFKSLFGDFGEQVGFQLAFGGLGLVAVLLSYPAGIAGAAQQLWEAFLRQVDRAVSARAAVASEVPLAVSGVQVSFGGVRALDDVAITVGPAEIVGLIGPNGAGKTTLLNVVSGVLEPASGSIRVFGAELEGLDPEFRAQHGLGRGFQSAQLFPGLTVTEAIQVALSRSARVGFVSTMLGAPWGRRLDRTTRARALEIVESFGLRPWADALTGELSTGTRRICDLACQVAAAPKVLLLDEPTAGVAQRDAEAFAPLLRRIRADLGCSILIVEHDMPLLMSVCDRVYAMETGRVIAEGTPDAIRHDPLVVASYLGTDAVAIDRSGPTGNGDGSSSGTRTRRQLRAAGRGSTNGRAAEKETLR